MQKTVLVIGAGLLHCYTIREAQALGLRVVATDSNTNAPGAALADAFLALDVYDIEGHRRYTRHLARTDHLVGVTCSGGDAAPTVAACAAEAGVVGIPYDVARRSWDKYEVRYTLERAHLERYQPQWTRLHALEHGGFPWSPAGIGGFPCVVKPTTQRASRGVTIVREHHELNQAIKKARAYTTDIIAEELLVGSEHSAEIVLDVTGDPCHFHVCDRFFSYEHGVPLERGHINPSNLTTLQHAAIRAMLLRSADAMGITVGSWKCDVIYTSGGPKIVEGTARCSGGFDAQVSYPRSSGENLLRCVIQVACGLPVTSQRLRTPGKYCAIAAIIPRTAGSVCCLPSLGAEVIWAITPGETVQPPQHCAERAGFVVAEGDGYAETWHAAYELAEAYAHGLAAKTTP